MALSGSFWPWEEERQNEGKAKRPDDGYISKFLLSRCPEGMPHPLGIRAVGAGLGAVHDLPLRQAVGVQVVHHGPVDIPQLAVGVVLQRAEEHAPFSLSENSFASHILCNGFH